jgi:tRNA nucleotidyltransferase/poly(A) polymerase
MTQPNIVLPGPVETALGLLEHAGFEAWVVGGCTRDALLGGAPKDWDITTSALPAETLSVFSDFRTIETGLQHGTVAVLLDGMLLEITTYRVDGTYKDSRHPDAVTFTRSIDEDLARRDFTMNAIAYSPARGYEDLYGGASDIEAHLIRCVGDPETRFTEDALRILRALRFSSVLGFAIEEQTASAIHALKERILHVAWERISAELLQLLCGKDVYRVLQDYRDVFAVLFPELEPCFDFPQNNPWHIYDVYTHIAHSVESIAPEPALRLTMLLHDIGKPETYFTDDRGIGHFYGHPKRSAQLAEAIVHRLRLSSAMQQEVCTLVEYHDYPVEPSEPVLLRRLHKFGPATLRHLLLVKRADCLAQNPEKTGADLDKLSTIEHMLDVLLKKEPAFRVADLAISGGDLIALGMRPGPQLGAFLESILEAVMAGELPNDREALLAYVRDKGMKP